MGRAGSERNGMGWTSDGRSCGRRTMAKAFAWLVWWTGGVRWAWAGTLTVTRVTVVFPVSDCTPYQLVPVQIAMCDSFVALAELPEASTNCVLPLFTCGPADPRRQRKLLQDDFEFFTMVIEVADGSEEEIEESANKAAGEPDAVQEGAVDLLRTQEEDETADSVEETTVLPGTVRVEEAEPEEEECEADADCDDYETPYCLRGKEDQPAFSNICVECFEDFHCSGIGVVCFEFQCVDVDSLTLLSQSDPPPPTSLDEAQAPPSSHAPQPPPSLHEPQPPPVPEIVRAPPTVDTAQVPLVEVTVTVSMQECSFVSSPLALRAMCESSLALAGYTQGEAVCRPEKLRCSSQPLQERQQSAWAATLVMVGFRPIALEDVDMAFRVAFDDPSSVDDFVDLVTDMLVDIPSLAKQLLLLT